jgi:hypothetical protein
VHVAGVVHDLVGLHALREVPDERARGQVGVAGAVDLEHLFAFIFSQRFAIFFAAGTA